MNILTARKYTERRLGMSKLKELRLERKMTLKQLSDALGIPIGTLGNYEQNFRSPRFPTANKIAAYFERPIEEIFPEYQRTAPYPEKIAKT